MNRSSSNSSRRPPWQQTMLKSWETVVGPNMPKSEFWLCMIPTIIAMIAVPLYAIFNQLNWNFWQLVISAFFAFDLIGGAIVNVTGTTHRWHHHPEHGFKYHFLFIMGHLHPLIVAWLYVKGDWTYFIVVYSYLLVAALWILKSPVDLQRPLSMILYVGGLFINTYVFAPIPGLEWFLPIYFLKLLVSYLPKS
jgi:hypothetical protein